MEGLFTLCRTLVLWRTLAVWGPEASNDQEHHHFLFPWLRPFGLFLSSDHSLSANRFPVNRKNENIFQGAEAPTQNVERDPRFSRRPRREKRRCPRSCSHLPSLYLAINHHSLVYTQRRRFRPTC